MELTRFKSYRISVPSLFKTFQPNVPFLYPLKTLENYLSDVFRGYRNEYSLIINTYTHIHMVRFRKMMIKIMTHSCLVIKNAISY